MTVAMMRIVDGNVIIDARYLAFEACASRRRLRDQIDGLLGGATLAGWAKRKAGKA
jgi:hypothetical protein